MKQHWSHFAPHTRDWLLEKFAKGTFNYWFTFVADFTTAMFFLYWQKAEPGSGLSRTLLTFGFGLFAWGLTEYIFHRWVYHQVSGIFGAGHQIHHTSAQVLIAMPWFMTTATMFGLWFLGRWIPGFSGILAGWLVGFVWYSLVHHSHHHWNMRNAWIRKLKAYHRIHHHFPGYNYGVTLRFWDLVFGTQYRRPAGAAEREESYPAKRSEPVAVRVPVKV